ncbi:hypothetical protein ACP70R_018309 [Stipagrostis hirtigluma subsp. patula]
MVGRDGDASAASGSGNPRCVHLHSPHAVAMIIPAAGLHGVYADRLLDDILERLAFLSMPWSCRCAPVGHRRGVVGGGSGRYHAFTEALCATAC